jgi:PAS domain S-box-containing protein/putative nucleotidyltransferase with HDIG domain
LIRGWRQKALNWILRGTFALTTLVLVVGLADLFDAYNRGVPAAQIGILVILYVAVYLFMAVVTFTSRLPYNLRMGSLLFTTICIGLVEMAARGPRGYGPLIIVSVIALASIFLNRRQALLFLVIGASLIFLVNGLLYSGPMDQASALLRSPGSQVSWLIRSIIYTLIGAAIVISTTYLLGSLEESLVSAKKQTDQLNTLQDIAFDILSHASMDELLQTLVCRAGQLLEAAGGLVFLVNPEDGNLVLSGLCGPGRESLVKVLRPGEGIAGKVYTEKTPFIVPNYDKFEGRTRPLSAGVWGSVIQVPVWHDERVIGVLGCYTLSGDLRKFDQSDVSTLERLARQASVAIENIRLIEAIQRTESRLDAIVKTAPIAILSLDLNQHIIMFNHAAEEMFFVKAEEILGRHIKTLVPGHYRGTRQNFVEAFVLSSKQRSANFIPRELIACRSDGEEFPVEVTIARVEDSSHTFLVAILRDITIKNQVQTVIKETETRNRVLLEFSKNLELSQTYQAVIEAALEVTLNTIGYKNVWFYSLSLDRKSAMLMGAAGKKAALITKLIPILPVTGDPYLEKIATGREPVIVEDAQISTSGNSDVVAKLGNRTIVNIPVKLPGERLGILGLGTFDDEGILVPDRSQLDLLATMAGHIAISIDRITQANERARAENEMVRGYQIQAIINRLLSIALENDPLTEKLSRALDVILSSPWLPTLPKGAIFITEEETGDLILRVQSNLDKSLQSKCARIRPGVCLCGRAALNGNVQFASCLDTYHESHTGEPDPHSHYNIPIRSRGVLLGVLVLYLSADHVRDEREVKFLNAVANTLAGLIERANVQEQIERANAELALAYDTTLEGWSKALDLRDKETGDHTGRVAALTVSLARWMGVPEDELAHIWRGALLHDIGKMSIPDATLKKTDQLTEKEWKVMRHHPQNAYDMLVAIPYLRPAMDIPYCHHEKWDGSGYPRGLKGKEIPLAARIFALVDVWDALKSDRPYRKAWPEDKIIEFFHEQSGKHFDPRVVDAFLEMYAHIKANGV